MPDRKTFLVLILLFAVSVLLRLPYLSRPLGWYYEQGTAITLTVNDIWHEEGGLKNFFTPRMTFGKAADKFTNLNPSLNYSDKKGNSYYVSFPPFSYMAPYLAAKTFGVRPNPAFVKGFSLFYHFMTAFGVFLIVSLLCRSQNPAFSSPLPALAAFVMTVFSEGNLWTQGNIYEMAVADVPYFVFGILLFLMLVKKERASVPLLALFWLVCFLSAYSGWLSAFFCLAVSLVALPRLRDGKFRAIFLIASTACAAAWGLMVLQYARPAGLHDFLLAQWLKFRIRSGFNADILQWSGWKSVLSFYKVYGPFLILMALLSLRRPQKSSPLFRAAVFAAFFPAALNLLILFNSAISHDFECIKLGVGLAILLGWLVFRWMEMPGRQRMRVALIASGLLAAAAASSLRYLSVHQKSHNAFQIIGTTIRQNARDDEMIFLRLARLPSTMGLINEQVLYYAHRGVDDWQGEQHALEMLRKNGARKWVLFEIDLAAKPASVRVVERRQIG